MYKIKFIVLFIYSLLAIESGAQLNFNLVSGYGSFQMADLKSMQKRMSVGFPVELKTTSSYPSYFIYGGGINYELTKAFRLGVFVEYGSSGARSDYHDYSGFIQIDQKAHYWRLASSITFSKYIFKDQFIIEFDFCPGTAYTTLDIIAREEVGPNEDYFQQRFSSANWGLQPTLTLYRIVKNFRVYAFAGFALTILKGKLYYEGNKEVYLQYSGNDVNADWGGYRVGIGFNYRHQF